MKEAGTSSEGSPAISPTNEVSTEDKGNSGQNAQDFEALFERSYGRHSGMDTDSKGLLKRDLFVLGLKMKWQEKVLPSAQKFAECLHQASAAEEQER